MSHWISLVNTRMSRKIPRPPPVFSPESPFSKEPHGADGYWSAIDSGEEDAYMPKVYEGGKWDDLEFFLQQVGLVQNFVRKFQSDMDAVTKARRLEVGANANRRTTDPDDTHGNDAGVKSQLTSQSFGCQ